MPGGWGRDRPPGGPRTRVATQKSQRAQGAGNGPSVPAEIQWSNVHGLRAAVLRRTSVDGHGMQRLPCRAAGRAAADHPPVGPYRRPLVGGHSNTPLFRHVSRAFMVQKSETPRRRRSDICACRSAPGMAGCPLRRRPLRGRRRRTSDFTHLLRMPSNAGNLRTSTARRTLAKGACPPGALLPPSCKASQGLQRTRQGDALFFGPGRFSFATGPGEGMAFRQTRRREDAAAARLAARADCSKIDHAAQKMTIHGRPVSAVRSRFRGMVPFPAAGTVLASRPLGSLRGPAKRQTMTVHPASTHPFPCRRRTPAGSGEFRFPNRRAYGMTLGIKGSPFSGRRIRDDSFDTALTRLSMKRNDQTSPAWATVSHRKSARRNAPVARLRHVSFPRRLVVPSSWNIPWARLSLFPQWVQIWSTKAQRSNP